jgi:hypothetical protein
VKTGFEILYIINVDQSISQSNDIQVSNSGSSIDGTPAALELIIPSADASFNTQSNDAANFADVDISNGHHGSMSHSGNVEQLISQSNDINATSSSPPPRD